MPSAMPVDVILLRQSGITQMLFLPYALLVSINMYGHYWWCTRIDPGTPSFDESSLATEGRYWATPKGRPSSWRGGGGADIGVMDWHRGPGAQPSGEINKGMQVVEEQGHSFSPASSRQDGQPKIRRCRKCSGPKPDVSRLVCLQSALGAEYRRPAADTPLLSLQEMRLHDGPSLPLCVRSRLGRVRTILKKTLLALTGINACVRQLSVTGQSAS